MNWIKIEDAESLPKKPGLKNYEQFDCMVLHQGDLKHLVWNCEHLCWDDCEGDDFYCDAVEPSFYMIINRPEA